VSDSVDGRDSRLVTSPKFHAVGGERSDPPAALAVSCRDPNFCRVGASVQANSDTSDWVDGHRRALRSAGLRAIASLFDRYGEVVADETNVG